MGAPDNRVLVLVPLGAIILDASTQVRVTINDVLVAEYAERMAVDDTFPPVVLFYDGTAYYLADGFHRMLAAQQIQVAEIAAEVRAGKKADALWYALGANRTHGQRLTTGDKQHAIRLALKTWPELSAVQIAEQIGCADTYVARIRHQVRTSANLPDRVTGKDGKRYPATKRPAPPPWESSPMDRSPTAVAQRQQRLRELAAQGLSHSQIAAALQVDEDAVVRYATRNGIVIRADGVVEGRRRYDPNRLVDQMSLNAEHLCADADRVDVQALDASRLPAWLASFTTAREQLGAFMRRLVKEQDRCAHG